MEKKQFDVCLKVLKTLDREGALKDLILIGSWCAYFYKYYFSKTHYEPAIRTRDMDFLAVPAFGIKHKIDIPELLSAMGFVVQFKGSQGLMQLIHPELLVEFLVPEKGRGSDKPVVLPQFGVNAQPLRFLNFLTANVIRLPCDGLTIRVPHPANFALHKFIISQRRKNADKMAKDAQMASRILSALIETGDEAVIRKVFNDVPSSWQKMILTGLEKHKEQEILNILRREQ